jgi:hypothetical protein
MNRLAEKVLPVMTDAEIDNLIFDHYKSEAQTLTTGAEANLLKFRELTGTLTGAEAERWAEIRRAFKRNLLAGSGDTDDPVGRVVAQLASFREGIDTLEASLAKGLAGAAEQLRGALPAATAATAPAKAEMALSPETVAQLTRLAEQAAPRVVVVPVPVGGGLAPVSRVEPAPVQATPAVPAAHPAADHPAMPAAQPSAKPGAPPQITGEYRDEFVLPLGELLTFPARTYTLRGSNIRPGAHLFVYDKKQPIVVRDGASVIYTPPPNPKLRPCVVIGEVALGFRVDGPQQATLTLELRQTVNRGLQEPYTEVLPVTIINPDGTYAPYVQLQFLATPQAGQPVRPKRKPAR